MKKIHQKVINTHILNSCISKRCYQTEELAQQDAERISSENYLIKDKRIKVMRSYQCNYCNKYHLTRLSGEKYERVKRKPLKMKSFGLRKKGKRKK
jgi:hypothetical protein